MANNCLQGTMMQASPYRQRVPHELRSTASEVSREQIDWVESKRGQDADTKNTVYIKTPEAHTGFFNRGGASNMGTIEFGRMKHDPSAVNVPVHDIVEGTNRRSAKDRKKEEETQAVDDVENVEEWEPAKPLF